MTAGYPASRQASSGLKRGIGKTSVSCRYFVGAPAYCATARNRRFRAGGMAAISSPVNTCSVFNCRSTTA